MPSYPPPSSTVQSARAAIADRLREILRDSPLTGAQLAQAAGWNPSKTSRIINAITIPSGADITTWCRLCGVPEQADDLVAASASVESLYVQWRRVQRSGLRVAQESVVPLYERTERFRIYSSNVIPGFLQSAGYASALLGSITRFRAIRNDVAEAVEARLARARLLRKPGHSFAFLIEQSVLTYLICDRSTMADQLGRLLTLMELPAVSVGIVPALAPRPMWPVETFMVFDDDQVFVELLSASVTVKAPGEIQIYTSAFAEMARLAVYGAQARALIHEAMEMLG